MPEAIKKTGIFVPCNAFRNYPLHSDDMNREKIGSSRSMVLRIGKGEWTKRL